MPPVLKTPGRAGRATLAFPGNGIHLEERRMPGYDAGALAAAHSLRSHLLSGGAPQPQPPALRLYDGEVQFFYGDARILAWTEREVRYVTLKVGAAGVPFNMISKANARARAAPRWRQVIRGEIIATNVRLIIRENHSLGEWYHNAVADVRLDDRGTYVVHHGSDAAIIDVGHGTNPWFYVLMCFLGLNNRNAPLW
jgi:hypothetical protein